MSDPYNCEAGTRDFLRRDPTEPIGFRIDKLRAGFFVAVLESHYDVHRCPTSVCADQAAYSATRGGRRLLTYLGMRELRGGEWVWIEPDRRCDVDRNGWTWPLHGHTHGSLDRVMRKRCA